MCEPVHRHWRHHLALEDIVQAGACILLELLLLDPLEGLGDEPFIVKVEAVDLVEVNMATVEHFSSPPGVFNAIEVWSLDQVPNGMNRATWEHLQERSRRLRGVDAGVVPEDDPLPVGHRLGQLVEEAGEDLGVVILAMEGVSSDEPLFGTDGSHNRGVGHLAVFLRLHERMSLSCPLLVGVLVRTEGAFIYLHDLVPLLQVPSDFGGEALDSTDLLHLGQ